MPQHSGYVKTPGPQFVGPPLGGPLACEAKLGSSQYYELLI